MFCLFRQGIEGLMSRCQKGEGRIAVDFLILLRHLSCLVFKLFDFCLSQFAKNQVELLLAVLREGGVGIDEKEVRRSRKFFLHFLFSQKESFPVFSKNVKDLSKLLDSQTEKLLKMQEEHGYLQR